MDNLPEAIARMSKVKTGVRRGLTGLIPQNTTRRPGARISLIMFTPIDTSSGKYKGLIMRCL
jgi:hypothetical protein